VVSVSVGGVRWRGWLGGEWCEGGVSRAAHCVQWMSRVCVAYYVCSGCWVWHIGCVAGGGCSVRCGCAHRVPCAAQCGASWCVSSPLIL
jgi:hypothetical protein